MLAAEVADLQPALGLLEYPDDLFLGESLALHCQSSVLFILPENSHSYWFSSRGKGRWFGDREDVLRNFASNFATESWMGNESEHHRTTKESLLTFRQDETDPTVIRWIDYYISELDDRIEQAEILEERQGS